MTERMDSRFSCDDRYVGSLDCRLVFPDRTCASGQIVGPIVTRAISISVTAMIVEAHGRVSERFVANVQHIGRVSGQIESTGSEISVLRLDTDDSTRTRLALKIRWLKKLHARQVRNGRLQPRISQPPRPAFLYVENKEVACVVHDLSRGGAGVGLVGESPPVGALLQLGALQIEVVRHYEGGFGARFAATLEQDEIKKVYERRSVANTESPKPTNGTQAPDSET